MEFRYTASDHRGGEVARTFASMARHGSSGMNCARCGRRLRTATVTIMTRDYVALNYGPKCARLMDLIEPRKASKPSARRSRVCEDPRQMDLIERNTA